MKKNKKVKRDKKDKVPPLIHVVIMHVNYCEQGQSLEDMCKKAVDWGFQGIEFRRTRSGVDETEDAYLDTLEKAVRKAKLKYTLFGSPGADCMIFDPAKRIDEIAATKRFFTKAAERFTLTVNNTFTGSLLNPDKNIPYSQYDKHGSFIASQEQWQWAADGYRELGSFAESLNFSFAFETHMCYLHDTPAAAKKLVDLIGSSNVGVNLDYGNAVYFADNPSLKDTISMLGSSLKYIHLKNSIESDTKRIPTALSEGMINHREYLRLLTDSGYTGPICIEAPRPGDREVFAKTDLAYIRSVMKELRIL